ncbi:MAG: nucleoside recognition family protein [Pseudomonadota bacterium]|nr:nucleoside recognition family protein [Pseudomonadota bacterium]
MEILTEIILRAGKSAVELAFFILLPVMVVMLSVMRLLEARGILDWLVARLAPVLRPLGLTGLSIFAMLQISFVSFAAPIATLTMMDQRGASNRHIAATLAMVMAMAQANISIPMTALGLKFGMTLMFSLLGGLAASASTYYLFARRLGSAELTMDESVPHPVAADAKGVLDVINHAGAESFRIAVAALPMLILALVAVTVLRSVGAIDMLTTALGPVMQLLRLDPALILPVVTKFLGGATAWMGVMDEMIRHGTANAAMVNRSAGLLLNPFDLPGVTILISARRRVAAVWRPAALGAAVGILLRALAHMLLM